MKIAMVNLTGGGLSGGYRKYIRCLVPSLREDPRVEWLEVFVPPSVAQSEDLGVGPVHSWNGSGLWFQGDLQCRIRKLQPDVVFVPNFPAVDCRPIPLVTMPRNMEMMSMPLQSRNLQHSVVNLMRQWSCYRSCRKATRILAISSFVREFLVHRWGISPRRIGLVPFGCDRMLPEDACARPPALADLRVPFFFLAGALYSYRGVEDAISALAQTESQPLPHVLAVAGNCPSSMSQYYRRLLRLAKRLGLEHRVIWLGSLSWPEMAWCYRNCDLFLMTSRVEACPNAALEAMSYGCLCLSTLQPPMPEFFQESALYYPASNTRELARKIRLALSLSSDQKDQMRQRARKRAGEFLWQTTARHTVDELEQAVANKA